MHRWGGQQAFPSVITVFSAPNYCGNQGNKGAVILIENEKMNIKQYKDVSHPFHLPDDIQLNCFAPASDVWHQATLSFEV